ncbi:4'-phosphopantetheinyl transferase psf-1 [compost metagenome]
MSADEVTVVYATLDLPEARLKELARHLSEDERARAARFVFARDRDRFVAARGLLRELLAETLGERPETLRFRYGKRGKPALESQGLRFNMSHSHGRAAYAWSPEREVGIDLERIRPVERAARIAERLFSAGERDALETLNEKEREAAFFRAWTRREAQGKGTGEGLAGGGAAREGWMMRSLTPGPGYVAALAVEGTGWQLMEGPWPIEGDGNER